MHSTLLGYHVSLQLAYSNGAPIGKCGVDCRCSRFGQMIIDWCWSLSTQDYCIEITLTQPDGGLLCKQASIFTLTRNNILQSLQNQQYWKLDGKARSCWSYLKIALNKNQEYGISRCWDRDFCEQQRLRYLVG